MSGAFERLGHVLPEESAVNERGQLTVGGIPVVDLARGGTGPLCTSSTRRVCAVRCGGTWTGWPARGWPNSEVLFASKSLPIVAMYAIAASEGIDLDVAGLGELIMAIEAGVPGARIYQHGNAKSDEEIGRAVEYGVGTIIVDGRDDLDRIAAAVPEGRRQSVLLRVIPSIDADTHESQATGGDTAKFGVTLEQAVELAAELRQAGQDQTGRAARPYRLPDRADGPVRGGGAPGVGRRRISRLRHRRRPRGELRRDRLPLRASTPTSTR